ncbi:hypothetical protein ACQPZJ_13155 [Actinoplanes sp. CA-054009]
MITGEDTVVIVGFADMSVVVDRMLATLHARWPDMLVAVSDGVDSHDFTGWAEWAGRLPKNVGEVMVARDPEMPSQWDENGYFTDAAGEGPMMFIYEPCADKFVSSVFLDEPYIREDDFGSSQFEGLLLGVGCSSFTLVSPDDAPRFRDGVLELLRRATLDSQIEGRLPISRGGRP